MPKNSRELRAKMSLEALERARVRGDVDAFAARGAGDDAGTFGENPGSESGGGVEAGAARGYVREHVQSFVKAMGGELKITARFSEGTVEIN
jgi:hypothetical protein